MFARPTTTGAWDPMKDGGEASIRWWYPMKDSDGILRSLNVEKNISEEGGVIARRGWYIEIRC